MRVACPACGQAVTVADGAAGTTAQCPKCLAEIKRPGATGSSRPGVASAAHAVDDVPARAGRPARGARKACYLVRCDSPEASAQPEAKSKLRALLTKVAEALKIERLGYEIHQVDEDKVPELRPDDMIVLVEITRYKLGSQFIRYMLTFLALLGIGDCRMDVNVVIRRGDGSKETFPLSARQAMGVLGGNAGGMMDLNVKAIANALVLKVARRRVLNATAYQYALASLILGIINVTPILGFILFLPGIILGIVALVVLSKRGLQKRKGMAKAGIVLNILAPVASFFLTGYLI